MYSVQGHSLEVSTVAGLGLRAVPEPESSCHLFSSANQRCHKVMPCAGPQISLVIVHCHCTTFHPTKPKPNQKEGHCNVCKNKGRSYESCCVRHLMLYHVSHLMCMTTNAQSVLSLRRFVLHQLNV